MSTAAGARGADLVSRFFGVVARPQTYKNLLYLALAFPLGIAYFVFLVSGYSTAFGLTITLVGFPLLAVMAVATAFLFVFERELAALLLPGDVKGFSLEEFTSEDWGWNLGRQVLVGLPYLFGKFAFGIGVFIALVTMLSVSVTLLLGPLKLLGVADVTLRVGYWYVDTWPKALGTLAVGVFSLLASLHVFNLLALAYGKFMAFLVTIAVGERP